MVDCGLILLLILVISSFGLGLVEREKGRDEIKPKSEPWE